MKVRIDVADPLRLPLAVKAVRNYLAEEADDGPRNNSNRALEYMVQDATGALYSFRVWGDDKQIRCEEIPHDR